MKKYAVLLVLLVALIAVVPTFAGDDVYCSDFEFTAIPYLQVPGSDFLVVKGVVGNYNNDIIVDCDCYLTKDAIVNGKIIETGNTEWSIFVDASARINGDIEEKGEGSVFFNVGHGGVYNGNIKEEGIENAYENMSSTFKSPRYECYVRAAVGLFRKAFAEEGKLPFSKEKTLEITRRIKNKKMPEFFQKMGMPKPQFEEKKPAVMKKEKLDMRGLECPEPVFNTQEKIWEMEAGVLEVLVDNEQAKINVEKTAEREGWDVEVKKAKNGEYLLVLAKA